MPSPNDPPAALPLTLDLEDFKVRPLIRFVSVSPLLPSRPKRCVVLQGDFSFDALFGSLVDELLPEFHGDDAAGVPPPPPPLLGAAPPVFPAVDELLGLFKHSCKELVDLRRQVGCRRSWW
jgi:exocyst complex component 5